MPSPNPRYVGSGPSGMALLALFIAAPLAMLVDFVVGPIDRERMPYLIWGLGAIVFIALMRYSRYRRELAGRRAQSGPDEPPGGANLMVAGILAIGIGALGLFLALRGESDNAKKMAGGGLSFASAGIFALLAGFKRTRARHRLHRARRSLG